MFEIKKIQINFGQLKNTSKEKLSKENIKKEDNENKKEIPKSEYLLNIKS
jgi:hypothetical protein